MMKKINECFVNVAIVMRADLENYLMRADSDAVYFFRNLNSRNSLSLLKPYCHKRKEC